MPADAAAGRSLIAMVYYVYSYRRWMQARRQTLNYLWSEMSGYRGVATPGSERKGGYMTTTAKDWWRRIPISSPSNRYVTFVATFKISVETPDIDQEPHLRRIRVTRF
jgi:hypothetical protein